MAVIGNDINLACRLLISGDVVAIPTETVYGLAGNIFNKDAIDKIYSVKMRPRKSPLIVHVSTIDDFLKYVTNVPKVALDLAQHFWPGPLTLILPKSNQIPPVITADQDSVAIRIPNHRITLDLLNMLSFPVAAPSANPYGYISPTCAEHVENQLGQKIKYILDGGICLRGLESTIIGFEEEIPVIFRKGVITSNDIKRVTGKVKLQQSHSNTLITPGMPLAHYSPRTFLCVTNNINDAISFLANQNIGIISFAHFYSAVEQKKQIVLSPSANLDEAAHKLYSALYSLDAMNLDAIIAEYVPDEGIGVAINDRLSRAAHKII